MAADERWGKLYFATDHLNSTRALTDAGGNVVETEQYDAFGGGAGSQLTHYGYTGRERDADTGLYYYRARWYDPQLGRFISKDPIGFKGGDINLYAYVGNNPVTYTDPKGLELPLPDWYVRLQPGPTYPNPSDPLPVYRCTRPIDGYPSFFPGHEYLCAGNSCGGQGPSPEYPSGGFLWPIPGFFTDFFMKPKEQSCSKVPNVSGSCVQNEINAPRPNYSVYSIGGENCWTWATNVLNRCRR